MSKDIAKKEVTDLNPDEISYITGFGEASNIYSEEIKKLKAAIELYKKANDDIKNKRVRVSDLEGFCEETQKKVSEVLGE